jgi:YVTN family beta-propeller protein
MRRFYAGLIVLILIIIGAHSVSAAPYAYITQRDSGTVTVYDTVKNKKVATIAVGGDPFGITMSPDGRKAFVFSFDTTLPPGPGWVSVVDVLTHSVTNTIALPGNGPQGGAVLPNGSKLYVADCGDVPGVTIINTTSYTEKKQSLLMVIFTTARPGLHHYRMVRRYMWQTGITIWWQGSTRSPRQWT